MHKNGLEYNVSYIQESYDEENRKHGDRNIKPEGRVGTRQVFGVDVVLFPDLLGNLVCYFLKNLEFYVKEEIFIFEYVGKRPYGCSYIGNRAYSNGKIICNVIFSACVVVEYETCNAKNDKHESNARELSVKGLDIVEHLRPGNSEIKTLKLIKEVNVGAQTKRVDKGKRGGADAEICNYSLKLHL